MKNDCKFEEVQMTNLNWELKTAIFKKFPTQADFAFALNVSESVVSRVIRGRRKLPPEEQKRWAKVLGYNAEELFKSK